MEAEIKLHIFLFLILEEGAWLVSCFDRLEYSRLNQWVGNWTSRRACMRSVTKRKTVFIQESNNGRLTPNQPLSWLELSNHPESFVKANSCSATGETTSILWNPNVLVRAFVTWVSCSHLAGRTSRELEAMSRWACRTWFLSPPGCRSAVPSSRAVWDGRKWWVPLPP